MTLGAGRAGSIVGGRYELGARIGSGAMGTVFEATDRRLGRQVAVKIAHAEIAQTPEVIERFRREVYAASSANSAHILTVYDDGVDPALGVYLVTERLAGEDLGKRLKRLTKLDVVEAVAIMIQAARGLSRAHDAGVIHRDLKPANIFLTRDDDGATIAKVLDFGVTKLNPPPGAVAEEGWRCITPPGIAVGTPLYMSPEQAAAVSEVDARTDVWALCAILFESIAGRPAFRDRVSAADLMLSILTSDVPWLPSVAPWVPLPLANVVKDGLARNRRDRIPSCKILEERLTEAVPEAVARRSGVRAIERD